MPSPKHSWARLCGQFFLLLLVSTIALQMFWAARIVAMKFIQPESTTFQRSEMVAMLTQQPLDFTWSHHWVDAQLISPCMQRAVIASEDSTFTTHGGVDWDAIEKAWAKNQKRAQRMSEVNHKKKIEPKIIGGSTITQQLAKNLFLSGERTIFRKAQELIITLMLETFLPKRRIIEIYLNNVEWGQGIFGVDAAAWYYMKKTSRYLSNGQCAQLAVMLPAPKRFQKNSKSSYLQSRASTINARMPAVNIPH